MAAQGQEIKADDFNAIRNKIINVLGTGAGNFGYGQTIQSTAVSPGNEIEAEQWNRLRWDIFNALIHQTGTQPSIVVANATNVIKAVAGEPVIDYNTLSNTASENRFDIGIGRFAVESGTTVSQSVSFSNLASCTVTATFDTADQARYFFNSGGKIRLTSTLTNFSSPTSPSQITGISFVSQGFGPGPITLSSFDNDTITFNLQGSYDLYVNSQYASSITTSGPTRTINLTFIRAFDGPGTPTLTTIQWRAFGSSASSPVINTFQVQYAISGGAIASQNANWANLLSRVGTRGFDGNATGLNFYKLTNNYQPWIRESPTGTYGYSGNEYVVSVSSNQANNTTGGATQIFFKVEWIDSYSSPPGSTFPDLVSGTLTLFVDQIRAIGTLEPTGAPFAITGPSYTASVLSTS